MLIYLLIYLLLALPTLLLFWACGVVSAHGPGGVKLDAAATVRSDAQ